MDEYGMIYINGLFTEKDMLDINDVLGMCLSLPQSISNVFYGIISGQCLDLNELDMIAGYEYSSNNYEKMLYKVVEKIYNHISCKYGIEWEDKNDYGICINNHVYKEGEYRALGYMTINSLRRDGKLQVAVVLSNKNKNEECSVYMTIKRATNIINHYYGEDNVSAITKTKSNNGGVYVVNFKDMKQIKLNKDKLFEMERING